MYLAITEVGQPLWWSQMTWKAALDKSGAYFKFSAKSRPKFTAEHSAIAASYGGLLEVCLFCVPDIRCPCTKYPNLQRVNTYRTGVKRKVK